MQQVALTLTTALVRSQAQGSMHVMITFLQIKTPPQAQQCTFSPNAHHTCNNVEPYQRMQIQLRSQW